MCVDIFRSFEFTLARQNGWQRESLDHFQNIHFRFILAPGVPDFQWDLQIVPSYYVVLIVNAYDSGKNSRNSAL